MFRVIKQGSKGEIVFEYITFTNFIIVSLLPIYLCGLAYCIGYGFHKGKAYWKRDYWFFIDAMEQCKMEEEMEMEKEFLKEEIEQAMGEVDPTKNPVRPSFIPQLKKKDETIH